MTKALFKRMICLTRAILLCILGFNGGAAHAEDVRENNEGKVHQNRPLRSRAAKSSPLDRRLSPQRQLKGSKSSKGSGSDDSEYVHAWTWDEANIPILPSANLHGKKSVSSSKKMKSSKANPFENIGIAYPSPKESSKGTASKSQKGTASSKLPKGHHHGSRHPPPEFQPHVHPTQNEDPFVPAITLEEFKSLDPEYFEWVNPDEIVPGGTTCGFLHAELGSLDVPYPIVDVYICMTFAKNQPAPRGNLAVHCGGPGSTSSCVYFMGGAANLGQDNADNYNIIAFDQRGMGRSWPSFVVPECVITDIVKAENGTVLEGGFEPEVDFTDPESIRNVADFYKKRVFGCWNCEECDFFLDATQDDGTVKTYHFLEYSGTRQLVEDIERFRYLIGDQPLSLYGISYGTKVMGLYATTFPQSVNLMVLDGNDDAGSDLYDNAQQGARGSNQRINYFIYSCTALNSLNPGACPVDDMRVCVNDLNAIIKKESLSGFDSRDAITTILAWLFQDFASAPAACEAAANGDGDTVEGLYLEWQQANGLGDFRRRMQDIPALNSESKPTLADAGFDPNYPFDQYSLWSDAGNFLVIAQDYSGVSYDEEEYIKTLMAINEQYNGAGTQKPAIYANQYYGYGFYWPKSNPLPPIGNSFQTGVIAGQLYDPFTPYIWTQKMRERFKMTSLLTSRSINHGFSAADRLQSDPACISLYLDYFRTGNVTFVDGTVCDAPFALESCSILSGLEGSACEITRT